MLYYIILYKYQGAAGEISKDCLLHGVDTLKNRRQAAKKQAKEPELDLLKDRESVNLEWNHSSSSQIEVYNQTNVTTVPTVPTLSIESEVSTSNVMVLPVTSEGGASTALQSLVSNMKYLKGLYAGFSIVLVSSLPQGVR